MTGHWFGATFGARADADPDLDRQAAKAFEAESSDREEILFLVYVHDRGRDRLMSAVSSRNGHVAFRAAYRDAREYVRPGRGWGYDRSRVCSAGRIVAEARRPAGV